VGGCIDAAATTVEEVVLKPGTTYAKRDSQPKRERVKSWDQLERLLAFVQTSFATSYRSEARPCEAVDEAIKIMKELQAENTELKREAASYRAQMAGAGRSPYPDCT
jgi:hypothetical protein